MVALNTAPLHYFSPVVQDLMLVLIASSHPFPILPTFHASLSKSDREVSAAW